MIRWNGDSGLSGEFADGRAKKEFEKNTSSAVSNALRLSRKVMIFNTKGAHSVVVSNVEVATDEKSEEINSAYAKLSVVNEESGHETHLILPMNKDFTFKI